MDEENYKEFDILVNPQTARMIREEAYDIHELGSFTMRAENITDEARDNISRAFGLPANLIESDHVEPTMTYIIPRAKLKMGDVVRDVALKMEHAINEATLNIFRYGAYRHYPNYYQDATTASPAPPIRMPGESLHDWATRLWATGAIDDPYYRRQYSVAVWRALFNIITWPIRKMRQRRLRYVS